MNVEALWVKRFQRFAQERVNYLVRIASGFLFAFVLITAVGFHYYQILLERLPEWFPGEIIVTFLYAWPVTRGDFRTWVEEADLQYLTPIESKMDAYFMRCLIYNGAVQFVELLLSSVVIYPLYVYQVSDDPLHFLTLFIVLLVLKGWNLNSKWQANKLQDKSKMVGHTIIRFCSNGLVILGLVQGELLLLLIGIVVGAWIVWNDINLKKSHTYHWYELIRMETRLNSRFYTFVSFFIDVPHLEGRVIERRILPLLTKALPFKSTHGFHYLYMKMFLRHPTSSMIFRLAVIGAVVISVIDDPYWALLAYSLFFWISGMQLFSFWGTYESQFWDQLYPLSENDKLYSFMLSTFVVLVSEGVLMLVPSFLGGRPIPTTLLLVFYGAVFAYVYIYLVHKKKWRS